MYKCMYVCVICSMCMSVPISQLIAASPPHLGIHWFVLYICVDFCFSADFNREKKYSSIHQNTDTSFPNQETLTSHL